MIERRSVVAVFPLVTEGLRGGARGIRLPLPRLAALARPRSVAGGAAVGAAPGEVPWGIADALRTLLWIGALAIGGGAALTLLRLGMPVFFAVVEALHLTSPDTYDRLCNTMQPYAAALTGLLYGVILYGAVLMGLYKVALRPHGLRRSALYLRHASWRTYGKVAALFVPITFGGAVVTGLERVLLHGHLRSTQAAGLFRGVVPLGGNIALLGLLLIAITPLAEEALFRGFLYRLLRRRLSPWLAAPISAALFAASHGSLALAPWLFYMGLVLALLLERTRSLFCPIIVHGLANGLATLSIVVLLKGW